MSEPLVERIERYLQADWVIPSEARNILREALQALKESDNAKDCATYDLKDQLAKAERVLERLHYRHCDIPACNCNSYHHCPPPVIERDLER